LTTGQKTLIQQDKNNANHTKNGIYQNKLIEVKEAEIVHCFVYFESETEARTVGQRQLNDTK